MDGDDKTIAICVVAVLVELVTFVSVVEHYGAMRRLKMYETIEKIAEKTDAKIIFMR